jgi:hypothetical protein
MIKIYMVENSPWCILALIPGANISNVGRALGEWTWVGRVDE